MKIFQTIVRIKLYKNLVANAKFEEAYFQYQQCGNTNEIRMVCLVRVFVANEKYF